MRYSLIITVWTLVMACNPTSDKVSMILKPVDFEKKLNRTENKNIIDLRSLGETSGTILAGASIITYDTINFEKRIQEVDKTLPVFIYCKSGGRSAEAFEVMMKLNFKEVYMLDGGILAWQEQGLPVEQPSKKFWNNMYGSDEYLYGVKPNEFLQSVIDTMQTGKILLPADGEGRNVVYAATQGWEAHAFDISENGRDKALRLAKSTGVDINFFIADFADPEITEQYDVISLIYAHMPKEVRQNGYEHLKKYLKPGGTLIVEAFSPKHLTINSPFGPKSEALMYTEEELGRVFSTFNINYLEEKEIELQEGRHEGPGVVVRMVAVK
ncbi:MAG: rhodanese-like domain-containing protein [Bacteroidota bacterium]